MTNEECRRYNFLFDELYHEETEAIQLEIPGKKSSQTLYKAGGRTRNRFWEIIEMNFRWRLDEEREKRHKRMEREAQRQWLLSVAQRGGGTICVVIMVVMEIYMLIVYAASVIRNRLVIDPIKHRKIGAIHIMIGNILPLIDFMPREYLWITQVIMLASGGLLVMHAHYGIIAIHLERIRLRELMDELLWFTSILSFGQIQENDDIVECPVCWMEYNKRSEICKTRCGHCFHRKCLLNCVIKINTLCPVCRHDMITATDHLAQVAALHPHRLILC